MNAVIEHAQGYRTGSGLLLLRHRPAEWALGRPVLLLHGSTLPGSLAYTLRFDGLSWLDDLQARGRDAWTLDVRGYGGSWAPHDTGERPCLPVGDTAQAVEDLHEAVELIQRETGANAVDLVGWSWGAAVVGSYAASGGQLGRLVLHAPQWLRDTPSPMVTPQTQSEPYRTVDAAAFVRRWVEGGGAAAPPGWRPALEQMLAEHGPIRVPNGSTRDIAATWMAGRPGYDPGRIFAPTLVVVGTKDRDTPPAMAREVFNRLGAADKQFAEIDGGSHFAVIEPARAQLFARIAAFLEAGDTPSKGTSP